MTLITAIRRTSSACRSAVDIVRRASKSWTTTAQQRQKTVTLTDIAIIDGMTLNIGGIKSAGFSTESSRIWLQSESMNQIDCALLTTSSTSNRFQALVELPPFNTYSGENNWLLLATINGRPANIILQQPPNDKTVHSPEDGADWRVLQDSNVLRIQATAGSSTIFVERVTAHIASIIITFRAWNHPDGDYELVVRRRNAIVEVRTPFQIVHGTGEARILGPDILRADTSVLDGPDVWDVSVSYPDGRNYRLRSAIRDIRHPRAVFRYSAIPVHFGGTRKTIRPYWTLDGRLSIELKGGRTRILEAERVSN